MLRAFSISADPVCGRDIKMEYMYNIYVLFVRNKTPVPRITVLRSEAETTGPRVAYKMMTASDPETKPPAK